MGNDPLDQRLTSIEERLARIEALFELPLPVPRHAPPPRAEPPPLPTAEPAAPVLADEPPAVTAAAVAAADPSPAIDPPPLEEHRGEPSVREPSLPEQPLRDLPVRTYADKLAAFQHATADPTPVLPYLPPPPPPAPASATAGTLERTIGLKWAAWAGALVTMIGAALGLKFAYDQGWLGGIPPAVRMVLYSLGAFTLLGAGEWAFRRVGRLASVGLYAAGVASLFLIAYAGHAYYDLYAAGTAYAFMALATVVGAAVAARADLVSIAVLSVLGAHLAPVLLRGEGSLPKFVAYLAWLQFMALLLAGRSPSGRWWTLRGVSLALALLWSLYIATDAHGVPLPPLPLVVYAALTFTLALGELAVTALRLREPRGFNRPALLAYLLPAFALLSVCLYAYAGPDARATLLAGGATAAALAAAAVLIARRPAAAQTPSLNALEDTLRLLALLGPPFAILRALQPPWASLALAAAGLALAVFSARRPLTSRVRVHHSPLAALAYPAVGLFVLLLHAADPTSNFRPLVAPFSAPLLVPALYALLASAALALAGRITSPPRPDATPLGPWPAIAVVAASVAFAAAAYLTGSTAFAVTVLVAAAWAMLAVRRYDPGAAPLKPALIAHSALAAAAFVWLIFSALGPRLDPAYSRARETALLNPTALSGLLLIASVFALPLVLRRITARDADPADPAPRLPVWPVAAAFALTFVLGQFEIDRVVGGMNPTAPFGFDPLLTRALLALGWAATCLAAWTALAARAFAPSDRTRVLSATAVPHAFTAIGTVLVLVVTLGGRSVPPVANIAFVSALFVTAAGYFLAHRARRAGGEAVVAGLIASAVLLVAGGVELVRFADAASPLLGSPFPLSASLLLTPWCAAFAVALAYAASRLTARSPSDATPGLPLPAPERPYHTAAGTLLLATAVKCVVVDLFALWLLGDPAGTPPLANLQAAAAAAVVIALVFLPRLRRGPDGLPLPAAAPILHTLARLGPILIGVTFFLSSSIEVARILRSVAPSLVTAGYSVWWALCAIAAVALGFRLRSAPLRFTGLGLFALTLLKVTLIDLADAGQGWRVLSFIALGLILLATSVLYGKLAPLLLPDEHAVGSADRAETPSSMPSKM